MSIQCLLYNTKTVLYKIKKKLCRFVDILLHRMIIIVSPIK